MGKPLAGRCCFPTTSSSPARIPAPAAVAIGCIGVDAPSHARLRDVAWPRSIPRSAPAKNSSPRVPAAERRADDVRPQRGRAAACFSRPDARCSIHRHLGAAAKPQVCREFPYHFVETPDRRGGRCVPSPAPPCAHRRRDAASPALTRSQSVLAGSTRVEHLPEPLDAHRLRSTSRGNDYRPIEAALLELLAKPDRRRCRSRCWPAARSSASAWDDAARGAGAAGGRGAAGDAGQRAGRAARRPATAGCWRSPAARGTRDRPSLTYLAPLYVAAVLTTPHLAPPPLAMLYGNYFRFRRARGPLRRRDHRRRAV